MSKSKRRGWEEAEVVVLCAIFLSQNFSAGDDEKEECNRIAQSFGRTSATIDRQWRNIKSYLKNEDATKVGKLVKKWAEIALYDRQLVVKFGRFYCEKLQWELVDLIVDSERIH